MIVRRVCSVDQLEHIDQLFDPILQHSVPPLISSGPSPPGRDELTNFASDGIRTTLPYSSCQKHHLLSHRPNTRLSLYGMHYVISQLQGSGVENAYQNAALVIISPNKVSFIHKMELDNATMKTVCSTHLKPHVSLQILILLGLYSICFSD